MLFLRIILCLTLFPCLLLGSLLPLAAAAGKDLQINQAVLPPLTAAEPPPATSAAAACLFDPVSGQLLFAHNAASSMPMASTTKLMTALVVAERLPLDREIRVPREATGVEGSSIYLFEGERITVETLLYALLLSSANDAATALAIEAAGSVEAFAALMNERAAAMALSGTHFKNPHGLHDEAHYTTAEDLAHVMAAVLAHPVLAKIVAAARYEAPQSGTDATRLMLNHNRLLRSYPDCIGGKTGFTKAGGRCLVSAAARDGLTLIAVTLRDGNDWRDHTALFDWGFRAFAAFTATEEARVLPVVGGTAATVNALPASHLALTLPRDHAPIRAVVELPRFLFAGITKGQRVGQVLYFYGDELFATVPLLTDDGVAVLRPRRTLWQRLRALLP